MIQGTEKDDKAGSVFDTSTSGIVEKITKQYVSAHDQWLYSQDTRYFHEIAVPLIIRATLEHYRDNVSNTIQDAGEHALQERGFEASPFEACEVFRAMISQALLELDAKPSTRSELAGIMSTVPGADFLAAVDTVGGE